jgi:hypothetical protein
MSVLISPKWGSVRPYRHLFCRSFFYVICFNLRIQVSNTIAISHDIRFNRYTNRATNGEVLWTFSEYLSSLRLFMGCVFLNHQFYVHLRTNPKSWFQHSIYIFHCIRYSRAGSCYYAILDRGFLLTRNILNQRFLVFIFKLSSFNGVRFVHVVQ